MEFTKTLTENEGDDKNAHVALPETLQSMIDGIYLEGFDLKEIINYSYENGYLHLLCELKTREHLLMPFEHLKSDYPREKCLCVKNHVICKTRRDSLS